MAYVYDNKLAKQANRAHRQEANAARKEERLHNRAVHQAMHGNFGKAANLEAKSHSQHHRAEAAHAREDSLTHSMLYGGHIHHGGHHQPVHSIHHGHGFQSPNHGQGFQSHHLDHGHHHHTPLPCAGAVGSVSYSTTSYQTQQQIPGYPMGSVQQQIPGYPMGSVPPPAPAGSYPAPSYPYPQQVAYPSGAVPPPYPGYPAH